LILKSSRAVAVIRDRPAFFFSEGFTMTAPKREQLANNAFTTLNGGIDNSQTSITVTDGSVFPSVGNFRIRIGDEILLCTARSTNTLTVVRGYEGTSGASHSDLANVIHFLTKGSLERWAQDSWGLWAYTDQPPFGLFGTDGITPLTTSDFAWINQGSATGTDQNGTIIIDAPAASGENCRILKKSAPSPGYTLITAFQACQIIESGSYANFGLCARQSTTGKFYASAISAANGGNPWQHAVYKFTNATTFSTDLLSRKITNMMTRMIWLKFEDDNTNCKFSISADGANWIQTASEARGTFLTTSGGVTGPDEIGFYVNNQASTLFHSLGRICHWSTF
jgi:hypothetical protein